MDAGEQVLWVVGALAVIGAGFMVLKWWMARSLRIEKARLKAEVDEYNRQLHKESEDARRQREKVLAQIDHGTRIAKPGVRPTPSERLATAIRNDTQQRRHTDNRSSEPLDMTGLFMAQTAASPEPSYSPSYDSCSSSDSSSSSSSDSGGSCGGD